MKNEKHNKVSIAILEIISQKGIEELNISSVAKKSSVSRAWIYQYMGKSKDDLMSIATENCASFFARSTISVELNSKDDLVEKLIDATNFIVTACTENPIFIKLYFRYKGSENILGVTIEKFESLWIQKFSKHIMRVLKVSPDEAQSLCRTLLILRMGYCFDIVTTKGISIDIKNKIDCFILAQRKILNLV